MILAAWMRLTEAMFGFMINHVVMVRPPDFVIGQGSPGGAYLLRWYITPWRGWYRHVPEDKRTRWMRAAIAVSRFLPSLYLHEFLRDDDDRAHHDHPAWSVSWMLSRSYIEHTIAAGGIHRREQINAGTVRFRRATHAHRIELLKRVVVRPGAQHSIVLVRCFTLFLFGPVALGGRHWGFHCPDHGFIPWERFTAAGNPGETGPGCNG